uniref:Uncharacterized protein n=1 Tax=Cannabis sativa TaxID=3483 RepID=A0A803R6T9_CANSA
MNLLLDFCFVHFFFAIFYSVLRFPLFFLIIKYIMLGHAECVILHKFSHKSQNGIFVYGLWHLDCRNFRCDYE